MSVTKLEILKQYCNEFGIEFITTETNSDFFSIYKKNGWIWMKTSVRVKDYATLKYDMDRLPTRYVYDALAIVENGDVVARLNMDIYYHRKVI